MKCVQSKEGVVKRVSDDLASSYISKGWKFVAKEAWKNSPETNWHKSSTPANPMSESKKRRKEMRYGRRKQATV
jgi:hypothetical protein